MNTKPVVLALFVAMLIWAIAAAQTDVTLSSDGITPSVASDASGYANIVVGPDKSITGSVKVSNIDGTAAHIHSGAVGTTGPVVATLVRTSEDLWAIPAGVVLSDAYFSDFNAGELYVDVHSRSYPDGELRAQLKP